MATAKGSSGSSGSSSDGGISASVSVDDAGSLISQRVLLGVCIPQKIPSSAPRATTVSGTLLEL